MGLSQSVRLVWRRKWRPGPATSSSLTFSLDNDRARTQFPKQFMTRRSLFKFLALLPLVGPAIAKALAKSDVKPAVAYRPYLPEFFPKWDKSVDGLESAAKWGSEIQRARLPSGIVFPHVGQIWVAVQDCKVTFSPSFGSPHVGKVGYTGVGAVPIRFRLGGLAQLRAGEKVRILGLEHPDKPLHLSFQPLRYAELHADIVPDEIRQQPGYAGYQLVMNSANTVGNWVAKRHSQAYFIEAFRVVEGVA
jgi:hypothetical protein